MKFSLVTLGVSSASPTTNRYPSAHILNVCGRLFLIDCGEGTQMLLKRYHISMLKISRIFISHLHGDHLFGLFGLLSSMALSGRKEKLYLYGPESLSGVLQFYIDYFVDDPSYDMEFIPVSLGDKGVVYEDEQIKVEAFPLYHLKETYGYLFSEHPPKVNVKKELVSSENLSIEEILTLKSEKDVIRRDKTLFWRDCTYLPYSPRSFAYCSDTAYNESVANYVKGVDLLYHEATFGSEFEDLAESRYHSTAPQAAMIALKGEVGKLVIGHYSSRYANTDYLLGQAKEIFPETYAADTGLEFEIPLKVHRAEPDRKDLEKKDNL